MDLQQSVVMADLPRWYGLSTRSLPMKKMALVIRLNRTCADAITALITPTAPIISHYRDMLKLRSFESNIWNGFGFSNTVRPAINRNGFVELVLPLTTNKGRTTFALAASLSILFQALDTSEVQQTGSDPIQLMTLNSSLRNSYTRGAPMSGHVSPSLATWLRQQSRNERLRALVLRAMKRGWGSLRGHENPRLSEWQFQCNIATDGRFLLQCPGNACDVAVYPEDDWGEGLGQDIGCHNLDDPLQQTTLITGLAKIYELADASIPRT